MLLYLLFQLRSPQHLSLPLGKQSWHSAFQHFERQNVCESLHAESQRSVGDSFLNIDVELEHSHIGGFCTLLDNCKILEDKLQY